MHVADVWRECCERGVGDVRDVAALAVQTPLSGVVIDDTLTHTYEAQGHDMHTLLFAFLDELLFVFSTELFVPRCAPCPSCSAVQATARRTTPVDLLQPVGPAETQHRLA
jgi:SHS2 domain-containing protein